MENQAPLPRHAILLILIFRVKEVIGHGCQLLLGPLIQDDLVPRRFCDLIIKCLRACPISVVHVDILGGISDQCFRSCSNQSVGLSAVRYRSLALAGLFKNVLQPDEAHGYGIDKEFFGAPAIMVLAERDRIALGVTVSKPSGPERWTAQLPESLDLRDCRVLPNRVHGRHPLLPCQELLWHDRGSQMTVAGR